jgi:hypothetical protein
VSNEGNKVGELACYELSGEELRGMVLAHADSIEDCAAEVQAALAALPPGADENAPPEKRRLAVFQGSIKELLYMEGEARYCAAHVPTDRKFMLTATQLLAFKRRWGKLTVDVNNLAWSPHASSPGSEQAERSQAALITQTPRILMPDGSLTRMGL